jgi:acyl carrier protein
MDDLMVISPDQIADVLERFIRDQFHVASGDPYFSRDAHLYELGFVDSTGVVELIALVESTFGIELKDEHIFSDAFTTINGISRVVHECLPRPPAGGRAMTHGIPAVAATDVET